MSVKHRDLVRVGNAADAEGWGGQSSTNWSTATWTDPMPATVQPITTQSGSTEDNDRRELLITSWRLLGGVDLIGVLTEKSRVRWDGAVSSDNPLGQLEVDGKVGRFRFRGRDHHVEATLKEVSDE